MSSNPAPAAAGWDVIAARHDPTTATSYKRPRTTDRLLKWWPFEPTGESDYVLGHHSSAVRHMGSYSAEASHASTFAYEIDRLSLIGENWDGYGAEPPKETARQSAAKAVAKAKSTGLFPNRILASPDGGVVLVFFRDDKDADLVFLNDGEVVAGWSSDSHEPEAFEVGQDKDISLTDALRRIREFIEG